MRTNALVLLFISQAIVSMGDLPILEKNIDLSNGIKRDPATNNKKKEKKTEDSKNERNNNRKDKRESSDHKKTF